VTRNRRQFLATVGAAAALGVTGCQQSGGADTRDNAATTTGNATAGTDASAVRTPTWTATSTANVTTVNAPTRAGNRSTTTTGGSATTGGAHTTTRAAETDAAVTRTTDTTTGTASDGSGGWTRTYGTEGGLDELFYAGEAVDGGYLLTGGTRRNDDESSDAWLLKVDADGTEQWETVVDDSGWGWLGNVIVRDDGYVVPGAVDNGLKTALRKYDTDGTEQWERTYSKTEGMKDIDYALPGTDGGYLLVGRQGQLGGSDVDAFVQRVDDEGNTNWSSSFGSNGYDTFYQGLTVDEGYVLAGYNTVDSGAEAYLVKIDDIGSEQWAKTYAGDGTAYIGTLTATDDGYVAGGATGSETLDAWLLKLGEDGSKNWDRTYPDGTSLETAVPRADTGYYVVGTKTGDGSEDIWVLKVDGEGHLVDEATFGGEHDDSGASITATSDGEYLVVGTKRSGPSDRDGWVMKRSDPVAAGDTPEE
jgi:hypothetical protein